MKGRSSLASLAPGETRPGRFAYADPPYPGLARRYYGREATYAGEVDHARLVARLVAGGYDGWALSTSARALGDVLALCPPGVRVCAWVKPGGAPPATYGPHNMWEAVIVAGGRLRRPGVPDRLVAYPARGGGSLPGRKPIAFCAWLFDLLGMVPGDHLDDLYPGTGIVGRSWEELSRAAGGDAAVMSQRRLFSSPSARATDDASRVDPATDAASRAAAATPSLVDGRREVVA